GTGDDRTEGVSVDRSGDVYVTGVFSAGANLGGGSINSSGMFLAKYSGGDGSYRWAKSYGGTGYGVATDPASGNVVFTGNLSGTTDFGGGLVGPGGIFLAMYDSGGNHVWSKCFNLASRGYSSVDSGYGVSFDAAGNVTFSGQVSSVVSFDGYFTWSGPQNF